ncbi:MAG: helix-turn-helix domain-containing protein [Bdellovibrionales bacterium]
MRDRRDDIPLLANYFVQKYAVLNNSPVRGFTTKAMTRLLHNNWEGNVRELENYVERLVVLSTNELIEDYEVNLAQTDGVDELFSSATNEWPTLAELEKRYIIAVLDKVGGRKEKAAGILGINRRTLYRKELEYSGEKTQSDQKSEHEERITYHS